MEPRIRVKNAGFSYDAREIFGGLDLEVRPGEVLCILGPNGCGKTTLLRCMSGALKLDRGSVLLDGEDIAGLDVIELAEAALDRVGMLHARDTSMIMTTHNPNHALLYPDKVAMMNGGRIVAAGEARDMITEGNLRATYGIDVRLLAASDGEDGETFRFCSPRLR